MLLPASCVPCRPASHFYLITKRNHRLQFPVSPIVLVPLLLTRSDSVIVFFCLLPVSRCNLVVITILCRITQFQLETLMLIPHPFVDEETGSTHT